MKRIMLVILYIGCIGGLFFLASGQPKAESIVSKAEATLYGIGALNPGAGFFIASGEDLIRPTHLALVESHGRYCDPTINANRYNEIMDDARAGHSSGSDSTNYSE